MRAFIAHAVVCATALLTIFAAICHGFRPTGRPWVARPRKSLSMVAAPPQPQTKTPEKRGDGGKDPKKDPQHQEEKPSTLAIDFGLFAEGFLNTVEDIVLHARRGFLSNTRDSIPAVDPLAPEFNSGKRLKKRVVVVGSGWAAHAFMKICETEGYDVVCVSPRPFFVFTPMLASTAVGSVEYRSIVEPVRIANPSVTYVEAEMTDVDVGKKTVTLSSKLRRDEGITLAYDYLVYAAGCGVNTMGMAEVEKYCLNLKEVEDVRAIKAKILDAFERAALPSQANDEGELRKLLSFAVVGAGPVGVEFIGGLSDFIQEELAQLYPFLTKYVTITLFSSTPAVLNVFDALLQEQALTILRDRGINVVTNSRVTKVTDGKLYYRVKQQPGEGRARDAAKGPPPADAPSEGELAFGLCLWAAGTAPRPLTRTIAERVAAAGSEVQVQAVAARGRLSIDPWMRLEGLPDDVFGSVFAMGDAAVCPVDFHGHGPLPQTAQVAAQQGAYVARLFNRRYRMHTLPEPSIPSSWEDMRADFDASTYDPQGVPPLSTAAADHDLEYFDASGRSGSSATPHAWSPIKWQAKHTAAWARVRGNFQAKPFDFLNLGQLSYVSGNQAVAEINFGDTEFLKTGGEAASLIWRSVYLVKQVSTRTRLLVLFDFFKSAVFGRDLTSL